MVLNQVFEAPFEVGRGVETATPKLFAEPLRTDRAGELPVYSAAIRPGVRFSDGTELRAEDVARSLAGVDLLRAYAAVEARDDRVVFSLTRPNARFDLLLSHYTCGVINGADPVLGTGPYMIAGEPTAEGLRLVRNPHYREPVKIEEIEIVVLPADEDGRPRALQTDMTAGRIDFVSGFSRADAAKMKGMRKWYEPGESTAILFINTERPDSTIRSSGAPSRGRSTGVLSRPFPTNVRSPTPPPLCCLREWGRETTACFQISTRHARFFPNRERSFDLSISCSCGGRDRTFRIPLKRPR